MIETLNKDEFGNILLPEVISGGISSPAWIPILKEKGYTFGGIGATGGDGLSEAFFRSSRFTSTDKVTYQPVAVFGKDYKAEDRYIPSIRQEWLKKGYKLPPMELFPLLCNIPFFPEFMRESNCRSFHCMHEPIPLSKFYEDYYLEVSFWNGDGAVDKESKTVEGVYGGVHMGFFSDCLFIFIK
jgi:hypothetical protein